MEHIQKSTRAQPVGFAPLDKNKLRDLQQSLAESARGFVPLNSSGHPMKLTEKSVIVGVVLGLQLVESEYGPMKLIQIQPFAKGVLGCDPIDSDIKLEEVNSLIVTAALENLANEVENHLRRGAEHPLVVRITHNGMRKSDRGEYINYLTEVCNY
jgi:hypothetical protein